jgi:hypothetical protein
MIRATPGAGQGKTAGIYGTQQNPFPRNARLGR